MSNDNFSPATGDGTGPESDADSRPQYPFGGDGNQSADDEKLIDTLSGGAADDKDEGFLGNLADDAGDLAKKTGSVVAEGVTEAGKWSWKYIWPVIQLGFLEAWGVIYGYGILIFVPLPIRPFAKKQLAFRYVDPGDQNIERKWWKGPFDRLKATIQATRSLPEPGKPKVKEVKKKWVREMDLHFYSQPNLVVTIHLIWVGWLVAACELYNSFFPNAQIPGAMTRGLVWFWLLVLCLTIIALGVKFGRVAFFFLSGLVVMLLMGIVIWEQVGEVAIFEPIRQLLSSIDLRLGWGIPMVMSLVLGVSMLASTVWQQLDDRWSVEYQGNFLDHENFQQKDRSIQKGAKTFQQDWPCLVRKFLLFGFGDILVKDSRGNEEIERIEGIFFARAVSDEVRDRFKLTDVTAAAAQRADDDAADIEEDEEF